MIQRCQFCNHIGEPIRRQGRWYCAMCGGEICPSQSQGQNTGTVSGAVCPICKNRQENYYDGAKYHCALCEMSFDLNQQPWSPQYRPNYGTVGVNPYIETLKKDKNRYRNLGILFVFLFWPVSVYFFYKFIQTSNELKTAR
ncbi:MAG: hypothetical protein E7439_06820 [Ruminococcaceae bacterium]|nr:hypothetical protein [Oscillospiraceae bacterium]